MSAIDEGIVREYFEQAGFFVRQARKYALTARRGAAEEVIDLVVFNPTWQRGSRKPEFFLFANELPLVHRAIVSIKGWHVAGRFTPGTLRNQPEIFRFLEENVLKEASRFFPSDSGEEGAALLKILVLPGLPTAEPYRSQAVAMLKERGVDAVISFRAMLLDLIDKVELNRNYGKSDTLQLIRVLKTYDLLQEPQLDLLSERAANPKRPKE
ncbi:MAG TPA: hypothetical protein VFJ90_06100 [Candidatus Didemnitutus sp.]|nr:hypothetical protein [Candidatus Didemnitutus sp.]